RFQYIKTSYFYCVFYRRCVGLFDISQPMAKMAKPQSVVFFELLVYRLGSRFCYYGWRRLGLFVALHFFMLTMCAAFVFPALSLRIAKGSLNFEYRLSKDAPESLGWLHNTSSYLLIRPRPTLYAGASYITSWGMCLFSAIVWMIFDLKKELKSGMKHASNSTRRYQKRAVTALTLQVKLILGIVPGIFYILPVAGLIDIYMNLRPPDMEEAYKNTTVAAVSAMLFVSISLHTFAHSLIILAFSPTYRRTIYTAAAYCSRKILPRKAQVSRQKTSQTLFIAPAIANQQIGNG
ncbi:hypothetical protein PRIPAC_81665, partial [Pristionchus pacificus]|uniref:G protein-coupled receptor n=1 Tax=Pristionchus pacificus TaxID=54126 RepID=A0A2A6CKV0_PRIPA